MAGKHYSRKSHASRKSGLLGKTKKVVGKTVSLLESGLSGLFGIVKSGVQMGVTDVKKGISMIRSRGKGRHSHRNTRRRKH